MNGGRILHQHIHPVVIVDVRTAGDFVKWFFRVLSDVGLVTAVQISVVFRPHVAAASPQLSLPTPKNLTFQGSSWPFSRRNFDIGEMPSHRHVFDPFLHLLDCAAADVTVDVGFSPDLSA